MKLPRSLSLLSLLGFATASANWKTFRIHGVNLGGWLVQESTIDTAWWTAHAGNSTDEWGLCEYQGAQCGPVLEERYASWITTSHIDKLASVGINFLRIPTTYAAWIRLPGSALYTGNQTAHLREIVSYAVQKHGMHVSIDLHSLPGGVNGQPIGERDGNFGWFHNETALSWSLKAVDAALAFIVDLNLDGAVALEAINEPVDNEDFEYYGTPASLSDAGAAWVLRYYTAVLARATASGVNVPVVFQGGFRMPDFWEPLLANASVADEMMVLDVHNYYFKGKGYTASKNLTTFIDHDAEYSAAGSGRFATFVGEWSIEAQAENTLQSRKSNLLYGIEAFNKTTLGSVYWCSRYNGTDAASGEGVSRDYWNYERFIEDGFFD